MNKKKILIIGSISYKNKLLEYKNRYESIEEYEVKIPILDDRDNCYAALDIIKKNIEMIKWADEIHMLWDGKSIGTIADWQTAVALGKPVTPIFIEDKFTYVQAMKSYGLTANQK
jgi:hypothetical protein